MKFRRIIPVLLLTFITFFSCSRSLGYSVLLWDLEDTNLQDGQLLKVYFKSNISKVYIVGVPKQKERYEVPFWQVTTPSSKSKALKSFAPYNDYLHQYGKIKVDGLPVREEPVNTAKQVYRLHQDEIVKILYKGDGQDVMVGKNKKLPGDWLCVLTEGGSIGWCFSYNLVLFETDETGAVITGDVEETQVTNTDTFMDQILNAKWYPEYYLKLLKEETIDLQTIKMGYGFDTGIESGKIQVNIPDKYFSAKYKGIEKIRDNTYALSGTAFQIIVRNKDQIVVNYSASDGSQEAFTFVTLSEEYDLSKIIENERARRNGLLNELYKITSFSSQNYGQLAFDSGKTFTWNGYNLLVPSIISSAAKGRGTVTIKYLMSKNFGSKYDGVLTFKFEGSSDEVNFLYKVSNDGLNLESLDEYSIKDNIVESRASSPTVMFFSK